MKPAPSKIDALKKSAHPTDIKSVRSFLGLLNYLKRFIPNYSTLTCPLRILTKKNRDFIWTSNLI